MKRVLGTAMLVSAMSMAFAAAPIGVASAAGHGDAPVTFEDVLANPNDIEISVKWAKQQIQENRLEQAAATLERVLLIAPNADEVRLLYGVVLYRLGNLVESKAELDLLVDRELSEDNAATRDDYLQLIADAEKQWRFDVTLGLGIHYDSNRTLGPTDDIILLNNIANNINGAQADDTGVLAFLAVTSHYDPQNEYVDDVFFRVVGVHDDQKTVEELDLQAIGASFGAKGGYKSARLEGKVGADLIRFDFDNVADVYRADVRAEFPQKDPAFLTPFVDGRIAYEDFDSPRDGRDGGRYEFGAGVEAIIDKKAKLSARLSLDVKDADLASEDFFAPEVELSFVHALVGGQAIQIDASYRHERYREIDPVIANIKRRDDEVELGLKYLASLDRLFKHWGWDVDEDIFKDMNFTAGASFERNNSTIQNFEFVNMRLETLVTKTFRF